MKELPIVINLPAGITREIGRVISLYAALEHRLTTAVYVLLDISPKDGRIAVREPKATDRLEMIRELLKLKKISVSLDLKLLAEAVKAVQDQRNQIAHGIWLRDPTTKVIYLRIVRGQWNPTGTKGGQIKRSVTPEGQEIDTPALHVLCNLIRQTLQNVDTLGSQIDAWRRASRDKSK